MYKTTNVTTPTPIKASKNKEAWVVGGLSVAYLLLAYVLIGFKPEQVVLVALANGLFFVSAATRKFIKGFSVFIVFWVLFDFMKAFPNYWFNPVHIQDLYNLEKALLGFHFNGTTVTPNEYWLAHTHPYLDVLAGLFYLAWIPVPLAFAAYLFIKDRTQFFYFSLTFLLVNLLGFVVYYAYPAAPPWYVQQYGFQFIPGTPGNTAGLARFDQFFNVQVFAGIYAKSSNVFAAMPSLHASYPLLVLFYGIRNKLGWINLFFGVIMVGIWFAAVYASHHYVLDVFFGIICAFIGHKLFTLLIERKGKTYRAVRRMVQAVT